MMIRKFKRVSIAVMLICSTFILSLASAVKPVAAAMIVSHLSDGTSRQADMATVRQFLELKMVQEKLKALGIDEAQATQKLSKLSNEEIHKLASQIDKLAVAGDDFGQGDKKIITYSLAAMGILAAVILLAIVISHSSEKGAGWRFARAARHRKRSRLLRIDV